VYDVAIFKTGVVPEHGISLQDFRKYMALERLNVRQNGRVDSEKKMVENIKEIN
jgi:hypothetical protein